MAALLRSYLKHEICCFPNRDYCSLQTYLLHICWLKTSFYHLIVIDEPKRLLPRTQSRLLSTHGRTLKFPTAVSRDTLDRFANVSMQRCYMLHSCSAIIHIVSSLSVICMFRVREGMSCPAPFPRLATFSNFCSRP